MTRVTLVIIRNWMGTTFFGGFIIILFWVALIFLIIRMVRGTRQYGGHKNKTALDILKERYARGEIDKKEFEEKKKDLNN